jgi:hypothetical protein
MGNWFAIRATSNHCLVSQSRPFLHFNIYKMICDLLAMGKQGGFDGGGVT